MYAAKIRILQELQKKVVFGGVSRPLPSWNIGFRYKSIALALSTKRNQYQIRLWLLQIRIQGIKWFAE